MAEKSPEKAIERFIGFFQETVGCLTDKYLYLHPESKKRYRLFLKIPAPITSRNGSRFYMSVAQLFMVEECDDGMFKVHTREYSYVFSDSPVYSHHGLVSYHWHPDEYALRDPHLHLKITPETGYPEIERKIGKAHYPTSRICLEDFVLLLIKYYDIEPVMGRGRWGPILKRNKKAFAKGATWGVAHNE